ncbi:thymidylate kinase [Chrysoperla carnea]|uniref:thymidylate kinase n=1 Tax=Chrysoperla carnea TaxID=189513 RepID=UPI001D081A93|nr:thymidylate kinase [Chrysoperla carnea]
MKINRGKFIVFEGCDRSGKTTQCKKLVEYLKQNSIPCEHMNFPKRDTAIGKVINEYLQGCVTLDHHTIHLLFSANRWELQDKMNKTLLAGKHIVCDRYSFSGVAYTAAKEGMDFEWCKNPEIGLIKPDLVFYLKLNEEVQIQRPGYGDEIYEKPLFQRKVSEKYEQLFDNSYWETIEVDGTIDEIHNNIVNKTKKLLEDTEDKPVSYLW